MGNIPKLHCRQDVDTSNINEMEKIEIKYKTETKINFMYANLRSILNNNKRDEMQILVNEQKIDVLGITESWLSEEKENAEIGYYRVSICLGRTENPEEEGFYFI